MAHLLALQLRNLQTLAELGVEKNTTVVFPAPLMNAIGEVGVPLPGGDRRNGYQHRFRVGKGRVKERLNVRPTSSDRTR